MRLPTSLYIEPTNRCNSSCQTCPRTFGRGEEARDMTLPEFEALVGQFRLERVVLHGIGEPLLHPGIFTMVRHLKAGGCGEVLFNSNAALLDRPKRKGLLASGLDEYRVSLDAATPGTYLRIRGIPAFERVVANVGALIKERKEAARPKISFWFMGMRENIGELPALVKLAGDLGVDEVYLQRLVHFDRGLAREGESLMGREEGAIARAEVLASELGVPFRASGNATPEESLRAKGGWQGCRRPWNLSYVTANGNVLPCCIAPFAAEDPDSIVMGNAFRERFEDIWDGPRYREFRAGLRGGNPPQCCARCGTAWSL